MAADYRGKLDRWIGVSGAGSVVEWQWQSQNGKTWLTCSLLNDWPHAFGTRHSHPLKPDQLAAAVGLPGSQAAWAHQVHGRDLIWAETLLDQTDERPKADAVATTRSSHSVWVSTADCAPILMATSHRLDPSAESGSLVAAVHAGWRGTAAGIAPHVVSHLIQQGAQPDSIQVAIGPAISGSVYQVSDSVAAEVLQTLKTSFTTDPTNPFDHIPPVLYPDPEPGKVRLDIRVVNQLQLIEAGIPATNISLSPHCTLKDIDHFFSYRRDGSLRSETGSIRVQWSGIGVNP